MNSCFSVGEKSEIKQKQQLLYEETRFDTWNPFLLQQVYQQLRSSGVLNMWILEYHSAFFFFFEITKYLPSFCIPYGGKRKFGN